MIGKIKALSLALVAALCFALALPQPGRAQATVSSTTLAAAVTSTSSQLLQLTSVTGITAPPNASTDIFIDGELMSVTSVNTTANTVQVSRGYGTTRGQTHVNAATVWFGPPAYFVAYPLAGSCVDTNKGDTSPPNPVAALPVINYRDREIYQCVAGQWKRQALLDYYNLTIVGQTGLKQASPTAGGVGLSSTGGAGGAQSATTSNGATGGANTITGGVGGVGGTSSGTGGTGGANTVVGGAGGGTVTGGTGGAVALRGGAGGNGTSAGGTGGVVTLQGGAAGTGGTGTSAKVSILDGADATKKLTFDPSGATTATATTLANSQTVARTLTLPDVTAGLTPTLDCGSTGSGNQTCSAAAATVLTKIVAGHSTLSSNAAVITFPSAFTSNTSYECVANDITTRANVVQMLTTSSTTATITNTTGASDVISWICVGN